VPVTLVNDDNISINTTMALDTGASFVVIRPGLITHLGLRFNPNQTVEVASASGLQAAPSIILPEVRTLSQTQYQVNAVIVDIPESSKIDGLLGLSFLNYYLLNIDFPGGKLTLGR
jgi:predicted aspartyl protease